MSPVSPVQSLAHLLHSSQVCSHSFEKSYCAVLFGNPFPGRKESIDQHVIKVRHEMGHWSRRVQFFVRFITFFFFCTAALQWGKQWGTRHNRQLFSLGGRVSRNGKAQTNVQQMSLLPTVAPRAVGKRSLRHRFASMPVYGNVLATYFWALACKNDKRQDWGHVCFFENKWHLTVARDYIKPKLLWFISPTCLTD